MECSMKSEWFQKRPLNLSHQSMLLPREIFQNSRKPEMMTFPSLYREYHVTEWALSSSVLLLCCHPCISFTLPKPSDLHIPDSVMELAETNNGMVLVTGPAGSGKYYHTSMYYWSDQPLKKEEHIITLEDPLEFLHRHDKCIVSQREINTDNRKLSHCTSRRTPPESWRHIAWRDARLWDHQYSCHSGWNRSSHIFITSHNWCRKYHWPNNRCVSCFPAAPDSHPACICAAGCCLPEAFTCHKRWDGSCFWNHGTHACNKELNPWRQGPSDWRYHLHLCSWEYDCNGYKHLQSVQGRCNQQACGNQRGYQSWDDVKEN